MELILTELVDSVGTITFNNPEMDNALNGCLLNALVTALEGMRANQARVVILRALPGAKVFSAGHGVRELPLSGRDP